MRGGARARSRQLILFSLGHMARVGILLFASAIFIGLLDGCKGELRGKSERSVDAKTYLVVDDDNGGGCGPILVDGRNWPHPIHSPGPIEPGVHKIECGGAIEFEIRQGTTFHFNYWGP
jgi:hypothetical protein